MYARQALCPPQYGFNVNPQLKTEFAMDILDFRFVFLYGLARFDLLETNLGRSVLNRNGHNQVSA